MRRLLATAPVLLLMSGCAITDRLDITNHHLGTVTRELNETNQRLGDVESKLADVNARLDETNRKMNTVEQAVLQNNVLRPNLSSPVSPSAPLPSTPGR